MSQSSTIVIRSEAYGEFEIDEKQIYELPRAIPGFPHIHQYALIQLDDVPYCILHALDEQLSFILLPAHLVLDNFGFSIDAATVDVLGAEGPEAVAPYLIVNIIDDIPHVNLKAPLLLEMNTRRGHQYIIDDPTLPIRYPLVRKEDE